jgi:hypothetical protein
MKRFLTIYVKLVVLSTAGMIAARTVVKYVLGMEQYEEYILATSVALGTVWGLRMEGIRIFCWTLFYLFYEIFLVAAGIIYGTSKGFSAGTIFVRFLFGTIIMALLILGLRLYVFKNMAIKYGRLEFGCFDNVSPELLCDEEEKRKKRLSF